MEIRTIKLAVADDFEIFRNSITKLLHTENDFEVVLQAENGKDLLEKLLSVKVDIILMDIRMPELLKAIRIVYSGGLYMTDHAGSIIQENMGKLLPVSSALYLGKEGLFLLKALCKGKSSTEIGKLIFKSPRTVEKHREDLYKKFGVATKEEMIHKASKQFLI